MPANHQRQQTTQPPISPTPKAIAKYKNKDGLKFITVLKVNKNSDSSEPSPAMAQSTTKTNGQMPTPPTETNGGPPVNRKKQKRRQKQAARLAASQQANDQANGAASSEDMKKQAEELQTQFREQGLDERFAENDHLIQEDGGYSDEDGDAYSGSYANDGSPRNEYGQPSSSKKSKKKKAKGTSEHSDQYFQVPYGIPKNHVSLPLPPLQSSATMQRGPGISKEKIWNTSSQEERERIKEFWLSLGEDERKSLVKVEKDAVLKKMKEQQKHSCSCTVCGRKRTAIEEELEVLYDAYYEELEQYANHQGEDGIPPMMPPPRRFGALSGLQPPDRLPPAFNGKQPSRGRIVEQLGDEEDEGDEEYSEDDGEEDDYSDDEPPDLPRSHAADFFNFGNSLTVQGGILTVADDLLKNDGKKFIEMMEQLAERRMAREEDAREQYSNPNYGHPPNGAVHSHPHNHNHPPPPDEEEYDEEEEEEDDYDSQEDDYDDEEMDTMTEEQRMEEGRRMFQIFAARMFEQRVLTAYKEKVAKERQQKLLEELEEESRADSQKKAKKAKDAQKRKDKVQQKKQALAEEKAKREAEKAAEEAAQRVAEEMKAEEQRSKAEERRKKKEAQKKAEEEERLRKEAEKQKRLQEQRERQAEQERKHRKTKERERKEKEELRQKEREAREAKEREAKERKERQEKEKREKEAKAKAEREAREKQKRDEFLAQQAAAQAATAAATASKRTQQPHPVPIPSSLSASSGPSPHVQVATPAVLKAPTPIKLRTTSQQESSNSSVPATPLTGGKSQNVSPNPSTPLHGSPGAVGKGPNPQPALLHHPQATSPVHAALKGLPAPMQPPFGAQQMGMGFQPGMPMMAPGFGTRQEPMFPQQFIGGQPAFRPIAGPNGVPIHPVINMHQMPQGRGFPMQQPPPGFPQQMPNDLGGMNQPFAQKESAPPQSHSRHQSASYDKPFEPPVPPQQAQPIARPAPIGRPSSVVHGNRHGESSDKNDVDDLSNHLGSSALLDDSDEPWTSRGGGRRSSIAPGDLHRQNFAPAPYPMESSFGNPMNSFNSWGAPPNPFAASSLPGSGFAGGWGPASVNSSFGSISGSSAMRHPQARSVAVRLMICRASKSLEGSTPDGFLDANIIKETVNHLNPPTEQPVSEKELLDICDTEGNHTNGGGSFIIRPDGNDQHSIRFEADALPNTNTRPVGAPGEIGSPVIGAGGMPRFGGPPPGF